MALFESADDAVKAGNELYKAIVLDPKTAEELNVSSINIGIGLHSGMAMLISKDTLDRMEDTEKVNLRYLGMVQVAGVYVNKDQASSVSGGLHEG